MLSVGTCIDAQELTTKIKTKFSERNLFNGGTFYIQIYYHSYKAELKDDTDLLSAVIDDTDLLSVW